MDTKNPLRYKKILYGTKKSTKGHNSLEYKQLREIIK